ncbi:hypothetical protein FRX31_031439 [Thalictrum thalictroides]|uniref:Uncharacterized protein n=1 Tax=Thalictrum thalictroides TaxID=46969 RepID=A0A7J6V282_THATH|nr:hypothetical protein FRX31_031439 [Thalictrum thalictroides]
MSRGSEATMVVILRLLRELLIVSLVFFGNSDVVRPWYLMLDSQQTSHGMNVQSEGTTGKSYFSKRDVSYGLQVSVVQVLVVTCYGGGDGIIDYKPENERDEVNSGPG